MATIKGQGAPMRDTKGSIGDTYTDITTGRKYKCTNAYGVHGNFDYTWVLQTGKPATPVKEEVKVEAVPAVEVIKEEPVEEPAVTEAPVKQTKKAQKAQKKAESESNEETVEPAQKRTDYAAAYNKKAK